MMESVVMYTTFLTVQLLNVIQMGNTRAVVIVGVESVVTQPNIVLVRTVKTSNLQNCGERRRVKRSGETTESVVITTAYQMVLLLSVTLTERAHAVVIYGMEFVVTRQNIALVNTVQITDLSTENGGSQEANRSGELTESVVVCTPYLMGQRLSVTLMEKTLVVVKGGMVGVGTQQSIVPVITVQTTGSSTRSGESPEA